MKKVKNMKGYVPIDSFIKIVGSIKFNEKCFILQFAHKLSGRLIFLIIHFKKIKIQKYSYLSFFVLYFY